MKCDAVQDNLNSARGNSDASPNCIATLAGFFIGDTMKQILLTRGMFAIVDNADYDWLNQWKWCALKDRNTFYAARYIRLLNGKQTIQLMHRQILNLEFGDKRQGDHKNHYSLDNQRGNLRICTHKQNIHNSRPRRNCSSEYKGVSWCKRDQKWRVHIRVNNHLISLGIFKSEINAAKNYDKAAIKYFGNFAYTNFQKEQRQ
jgi:hypothetical protein